MASCAKVLINWVVHRWDILGFHVVVGSSPIFPKAQLREARSCSLRTSQTHPRNFQQCLRRIGHHFIFECLLTARQ